ncbi:MAG: hypothetical protein Q8P72_05205 [Candidatus Roizmanbacteria bacterium]|nr:hypothetical protein [Candidatus Roizmanbacteria bacterium]
MQYYDEIQYIARVNTNDSIQEKIERWKAHKKGILHRAITVVVKIKEDILLQHRKHPVFDSVYDMTISTHQIYDGVHIQSDEEAIYQTLERELHIKPNILTQKPTYSGNVVYRAEDPKSAYIEHEVCHVYTCTISSIPLFNPIFAYEVKTASLNAIKNQTQEIYPHLAPWVKEMIQKGMV